MTPFGFSGLLAGISSLGFGIFVLAKSRDRQIARVWCLYTISVAVWGFAAMWIGHTKSPQQALMAWRWGYAFGVIWITPIYYWFVCSFLGLKRPRSVLIHTAIGFGFLLELPSKLFFARLVYVWNSMYFIRSGVLHYVFIVWWVGLAAYSHYLLYQASRNVSREKRNQIKYFFAASLVGFTGGSLGYLCDFGINLYPWSHFSICLYPVIMSIAIVKHQLLDINLFIRKTLIYSIVTAVLTAAYVVIMLSVSHSLEGLVLSPTAYSSAAAACAMALLFHPIRMKIQRFVDRHFFRESMDQDLLREATSGFVHEIKRPLAKIALPAELSMGDLKDLSEGKRSIEDVIPRVLERLQFIVSQSTEAGKKMEAIREVSMAEQSALEDVHLKSVIQKAIDIERELLERCRVAVAFKDGDDIPIVKGRSRQLEIVISNIIKNAAEAMSDLPVGSRRQMTIQTSTEDRHVAVMIKDSGRGIRPENIPYLFEPYFSTKGSQGMGVGLFLCRQIIHAHGGTIRAQNSAAGGAEFDIALPIIQ